MEYRPSSISSHIPDQFPKIYREDGPDFIAFVQSYYEFLDGSNERNFSALGDIDNTIDEFLKYYKKKYLHGLPFPEGSLQDIPFLVKNIADLYRSKGTREALELMFMMFYKEEIETYYPASSILSLSDSKWAFATYLEFKPVTSTTDFPVKKGDIIEGDTSKATAFVDQVVFYNIDGVQLPVGYISNVYGDFINDDSLKVTRNGVESFPGRMIYGSIAKPEVSESDVTANNKPGDKVKLVSDRDGVGAEAVVRKVSDIPTGTIEFILENGGWGYDTTLPLSNQTYADATDNQTLLSTQVLVLQSGSAPLEDVYPGDIITGADNTASFASFSGRIFLLNEDGSIGPPDGNLRLFGKSTVIKYEHPLLFVSSYDDADTEYLNPQGISNVPPFHDGAFHQRSTDDLTEVIIDFPQDSVALLKHIPAADYVSLDPNDLIGVGTSIYIEQLSEFNDTSSFEPETFDNKETVTFFTDIIGDFANTQLVEPIVSLVADIQPNVQYEILSTSNGFDYSQPLFNLNNPQIGQLFSINQSTFDQYYATTSWADFNGTSFIDKTASNYRMSGQFYTDSRTRLADALGAKDANLGSIKTIKITNGGSGFTNNVAAFVRNVDMAKFGYGTMSIRFDKSNFGIQIGQTIEQDIEVPNLARDSQGRFTNLGETIPYTAKAKLLRKSEFKDEFVFQQLSFYPPDATGNPITFFGNILNIERISRLSDDPVLGENASIQGDASYLAGQITDIEVTKSGFRYQPGEKVRMINIDEDNTDKYNLWVGSANVNVTQSGKTEGKWITTTSHISDRNRFIHDNDYYQEYSYDVSTILDPTVYESALKDTVHVAGTKFFGTPLVSATNNIAPSIDSNIVRFNRQQEFLITEGTEQNFELESDSGGQYQSVHEQLYATQLTAGESYIITSLGDGPYLSLQQAWNSVAGTINDTYSIGSRIVAQNDGAAIPARGSALPARFKVELENTPITYVEFDL